MPLILGIETSCDETAAAVVADGVDVRSSIIATQHDLHRRYGGVVPEIASRSHLERILPVLEEAVTQAGVVWHDLDVIAVGNRPGLIGSLLVGVSAAKSLAWAIDRPIIGVDHVQAHLFASMLRDGPGPGGQSQADMGESFPALGLVVSGGHTSLYRVDWPWHVHLLGRTIDDAIGEAYDKAAVILGLPYPGGPNLDRLAQQGDGRRHELPRSLLDRDSLDFSFSGLKTALLYKVRGQPVGRGVQARFERDANDLSDADRADLAAAFQLAAVETLMIKITRALEAMARHETPARRLLLGGGVCANSLLRRRVMELGRQRQLHVGLPAMQYCLDNAAMIAGLAHLRLQAGQVDDLYLPAIATVAM